MSSTKMLTQEEAAHVIEWLLFIVDKMIEGHASDDYDGQHGLCYWMYKTIQNLADTNDIKRQNHSTIAINFSKLMNKYIKPTNATVYWWPTNTIQGKNARSNALIKLRKLIEEGNIDPY